MTDRTTRRRFLMTAGAAFAASGAMAAAPGVSLRPVARPGPISMPARPLAPLIAQSGFQGELGFAVADQRDGAMLESYRAEMVLPPASVAKALTAAFALDQLGPGHHFSTRLIASGPVRDGVLDGDLILAGGSDPTLDTDGLGSLVEQLAEAGVSRIAGAFRVWGGRLPTLPMIDASQPDHVGYNPSLSGLNLNYNRVHFEWKRAQGGYAVTMQARSVRYRTDVDTARMRIVARTAPVYAYDSSDGRDNWSVASGALGVEGARWLPVRDPVAYAGAALAGLARQMGIALPAPVATVTAPQGIVVAEVQSPPLRIILGDMLNWSTNLTAEIVGMEATRAMKGQSPRSLRVSADAMNEWARTTLGLSDIALVDHSGLGDRSRISAAEMVSALRQIRQRKGLKPLLKPLTLRNMRGEPLQNHPVKVRAKTGTLNFVSALAGYVDLPDGHELVFAIFGADLDRRAALSKAERERPPGGRTWSSGARRLQSALILRWAEIASG
jgi:D-alanyl-D-alanine carboxypeptidase/D-alanyl-D-alanine-endopeptidase (penicillin-binding protein 4)